MVADLIAQRATCDARWANGVMSVRFDERPPPSLLDAIGTWLFNLGETDVHCEGLETVVGTTRLSDALELRPPWEPATAETSIVLEPSLAFGTGTHPTTLMALGQIPNAVKAGHRVLDIGTGSGILAIFAARLGARVVGEEIDPSALRSARRNGAANGVDIEWTEVPIDALEGDYDCVIVNVFAHIILGCAADIAMLAKNHLLLTGLLEHEQPAVLDVYPDFTLRRREVNDGWLLLHLTRRLVGRPKSFNQNMFGI